VVTYPVAACRDRQPAPFLICAVMSGSESTPEQCLILHIKSAFAHTSATTALRVQVPVVPPRQVELSHNHVVNRGLPSPGPTHAHQTSENLPKCFQNKRKSSKGLVEEAAQRGVSSSGRPPSSPPPPTPPSSGYCQDDSLTHETSSLQPDHPVSDRHSDSRGTYASPFAGIRRRSFCEKQARTFET